MRAYRSKSLERYLGDDELVVLETRQHPFAVLAAFLDAMMLLVPMFLIVWGALGIKWLDNAAGDWLVGLVFAGMVVVVARLAWHLLDWEFARLVITTEKVVHIHGLAVRRISSTPLVKVSELTVRQPIPGRIFGYGSLAVDAPGGGEEPLHGLTYIPDPIPIYRLITETARRERAFEGGAAVMRPTAAPAQPEAPTVVVEDEARAAAADASVGDDADTTVLPPEQLPGMADDARDDRSDRGGADRS